MVFPFRVWQRFQRQVQWLPFVGPPAMRKGVIAGRSYHFWLGRVPVQLAGWSVDVRFPPLDVIAQFEQLDPQILPTERLTHTVVGLQYGPLEGRNLVVSPRASLPERGEAWITDERPVDPLVLTSATL